MPSVRNVLSCLLPAGSNVGFQSVAMFAYLCAAIDDIFAKMNSFEKESLTYKVFLQRKTAELEPQM